MAAHAHVRVHLGLLLLRRAAARRAHLRARAEALTAAVLGKLSSWGGDCQQVTSNKFAGFRGQISVFQFSWLGQIYFIVSRGVGARRPGAVPFVDLCSPGRSLNLISNKYKLSTRGILTGRPDRARPPRTATTTRTTTASLEKAGVTQSSPYRVPSMESKNFELILTPLYR